MGRRRGPPIRDSAASNTAFLVIRIKTNVIDTIQYYSFLIKSLFKSNQIVSKGFIACVNKFEHSLKF